MSKSVAYISRPAVLIDGQPNPSLALDLQSLVVEETVEGLYRCEASFNNYGPSGARYGYLYFKRNVLEFGKQLAIKLGPPDENRQIFNGRISALEAEYTSGGVRIVALAEDRLQDLRMTRRTRTFEDASDEDVIRRIANGHGLTPQLQLDGPTHRVLAQVNLSDLAFIRQRARSLNAEVWVEDTTIHVATRGDRGGDTIKLDYGTNLIAFSVRADLAHQCTEVGVGGWDVAAKTAIEETAEESALGAELGGGLGGGAILQRAFAPRKERIVHSVPLTSAEARALAQARYSERARRFVTGTGLADGDPRIQVGSLLSLGNLGPLFDGQYYVVRARHTYDHANGFRSEFDVERPGIGQG